MSIDYHPESGVFCQVSPLVLAHSTDDKAARIEEALEQKTLFRELEKRLATTEKTVQTILRRISATARKRDLLWGVSLEDRLKRLDETLSGFPTNLLTRLMKTDGQFEMVCGYGTAAAVERYKEAAESAAEAILLAIFTMLKIKRGPDIYCFVNEGRDYPYINESFEFGRLYFSVAYWERKELTAIKKITPIEQHEWTLVSA
jgi:hypothetical protein